MKTKLVTAAAIIAAAATSATAGELKPAAGHAIHLGNVQGAAYYTVEDDGLRLVATVAGGETGDSVRFVSTLSDGQTMVVEVPGTGGQNAEALTFRRVGEHVVVEASPDLRAAMAD
ncbi:hypothetical protein [Jiella avicenniae]|uniref:Uncharacterized protein n=1 Tax=Jiella avicenniae TaxID=2907202 RepID=A0A9X1P4U9_9HYPH|nr:hypothetical protein [Jiella avicenniae]MCE7029824.1 hypothetical protein [Jiella avicenniae]